MVIAGITCDFKIYVINIYIITTNQIESNMFLPLLRLTEILTDDFNIEM